MEYALGGQIAHINGVCTSEREDTGGRIHVRCATVIIAGGATPGRKDNLEEGLKSQKNI